nr:hypothetical protein [Tanacetum cinerariifolium]
MVRLELEITYGMVPSRKSEWSELSDWESRFRTLSTTANDLEFIDVPWPQRPNLRVEHPRQIRVDVKKLSRGKEIVGIIIQLISPNLRDGLEGLKSLEVMNTIRAQHKIYAFMDM